MNKNYLPLVVILSLMQIFSACADDDDDNDNPADGGTADDDDDDDVSSDDDDDNNDNDDNDNDDNDNDDNDNDDDTAPTELLIVAQEDSTGTGFSLRQTADGWLREDFPKVETNTPTYPAVGPSFFLNGKSGWSTVNYFNAYFNSLGFDLLVYDPNSGWAIDALHDPLPGSTNATGLFAPDATHFWSMVAYYNGGYPSYSLWSYEGSTPTRQLTDYSQLWLQAMYFIGPNEGFVSASTGFWAEGFLFRWNGTDWVSVAMPAGYQNGVFRSIWLSDIHNGFFLWLSPSYETALFRLVNDSWQLIEPPAGCNDPGLPTSYFGVYGSSNNLFVSAYRSTSFNSDVFWEFREGQWRCRQSKADFSITSAIVLRNGQTYILGWGQGLVLMLFEVLPDLLQPISIPEIATSFPPCIHAVGPLAPQSSACRSGNPLFPFSLF
jgi:hypothetical protein